MKKGKSNEKEITKNKLKKIKSSSVGKRVSHKEPDLWKEIRSKLQPLSKAYRDFKKKRKIENEKSERKRLKELEEQ